MVSVSISESESATVNVSVDLNWWMDGQVEINIDIWRKKRIRYVYDLSRNNTIALWLITSRTVIRSGRSSANASFFCRLVICLLIWRNLDSSASPSPIRFVLSPRPMHCKMLPKANATKRQMYSFSIDIFSL